MRRVSLFLPCVFLLMAAGGGCAASHYQAREATDDQGVDQRSLRQSLQLNSVLEDRILALDPERITKRDITDVLSRGPTPRIINLHGGVPLVYLAMESFSEFLIGMGYPEGKIRNPRDGMYSYSSYKSSQEIAGLIAWYYEKEGMPPMLIGHSGGGMKVVKVLHELAGGFADRVAVWNPMTEEGEDRYSVVDPLTGTEQPVVGLKVGYATTVGSGAGKHVPHSGSCWADARQSRIASSILQASISRGSPRWRFVRLVAEPNQYEANGTAKVRNVRLPFTYNHVTVPASAHLVRQKSIRDWIDAYVPTDEPQLTVDLEAPSTNLLWAADVWHSVKKQWCLEAQRLVRWKRSRPGDP
jgi:hypothetical protein